MYVNGQGFSFVVRVVHSVMMVSARREAHCPLVLASQHSCSQGCGGGETAGVVEEEEQQ